MKVNIIGESVKKMNDSYIALITYELSESLIYSAVLDQIKNEAMKIPEYQDKLFEYKIKGKSGTFAYKSTRKYKFNEFENDKDNEIENKYSHRFKCFQIIYEVNHETYKKYFKERGEFCKYKRDTEIACIMKQLK